MVQAKKTCKGGLLAVTFVDFDLQVTCVCIYVSEDARFSEQVEVCFHARNWIRVSDGYGVRLSKVDQKSERAVRFPWKDN